MWTPSEKKFLKSINTPEKIQRYLDSLEYNSNDAAASARFVLMSEDAHCLEGGFVAASALELQGHPPLMVSLQGYNDDHHVIVIYRGKHGLGSISKSNTTLLRGRDPVYQSVRELVMSYFDFYFNYKGEKALYAYSMPINLNRFKNWNWRTGDENMVELGMAFSDLIHYEILSQRELSKLPKASPGVKKACFLDSRMDGLYQG